MKIYDICMYLLIGCIIAFAFTPPKQPDCPPPSAKPTTVRAYAVNGVDFLELKDCAVLGTYVSCPAFTTKRKVY